MANGAIYFAEDFFGVQFCIRDDGMYSFDSETTYFEWLSENLNYWCPLILNEYDFYTGYSLAHQWHTRFFPSPDGSENQGISRLFIILNTQERTLHSLRNSLGTAFVNQTPLSA